MPKRNDIHSVLIIGAGPIVIGQACEFDYSGTQACRTLKSEGYRTILVNSNPATIMTDPDLNDATYMEPIVPEIVAKIIEIERPDAILPTMGGQTALNCALALHASGITKRFGVEMIGVNTDTINMAEDRAQFRAAMARIGLPTPRAHLVHCREEALESLQSINLPAIIRPSFTLGGTGGGIAYNREEFLSIVENGIDASPTGQVLVEESVLGWKEYEMEVIRDRNENCIVVCSIENIDPMGIHTGDSITVAPALTLSDKEYQNMRDASFAVLREVGLEAGGANVQFAVNPEDGRFVVIEMNPRVSRSSALASKATGFPIAKVSTKLAIGYTLDEIANDITEGVMPASFEPAIDYVVTKVPRFSFEKFPGTKPVLSTSMKAVGEVMGVGRNFQESLQKALCSLEIGLTGLNEVEIPGLGLGDDKSAIHAALGEPTVDRLLKIAQSIRLHVSDETIHRFCRIDPWFISQIRHIVDSEERVRALGIPDDPDTLRQLKSQGFSDARLAELASLEPRTVSEKRWALGIRPVYKRIDTCAAEFASPTNYFYSTYESPFSGASVTESHPSDRRKAIILGSGPNRIGQGVEFDYCCCHAAFALRKTDIESIMINCNPETVSTDYDTSDRLYFEPLTDEHTLEVIHCEQQRGHLLGVIVQFGGQTPLKLSESLRSDQIPILGTSPESIRMAENRDEFKSLLKSTGLKQPENGIARSLDQIHEIAARLGYPIVVRPSYVLGGMAMEIVHNHDELTFYLDSVLPLLVPPNLRKTMVRDKTVAINDLLTHNPLLLDRYLSNAVEVDVDAIADGENVFVCGVMEHIEEAGIHSGDSACSLPPYSLAPGTIAEIKRQTSVLARKLGILGLINVQYAVSDDGGIYVLEANPRASRTVPFVAKVIGRSIAEVATHVMTGDKLTSFDLPAFEEIRNRVAVKEAVLPFARFPSVDLVLGPEMRSTGEVIGIDRSFAMAFAKSQMSDGHQLPTSGVAFISVKDSDKPRILNAILLMIDVGFKIVATGGTQAFLMQHGVQCEKINKVSEGRPHIVDAIKDGDIQIVINTTEGAQALADSRSLRRAALMYKVPYYTTLAGAKVVSEAICAYKNQVIELVPLQRYLANSAAVG